MQSKSIEGGWPETTKQIEVDRALDITVWYDGTDPRTVVALCQKCRTDYLKCPCPPSIGHPLDVCDIPPKLMQSKLLGFAMLAALAVDYRDTKIYEVTIQSRAVPIETVYQGYSGCNIVYYTNHFVGYESIRVTNYAK